MKILFNKMPQINFSLIFAVPFSSLFHLRAKVEFEHTIRPIIEALDTSRTRLTVFSLGSDIIFGQPFIPGR